MSLPGVMTAFENETQKSATHPRLSIHQRSFLRALCQEFVRSTTHRRVDASRRRLASLEDQPYQATFSKPLTGGTRVVAAVQMHPRPVEQETQCLHTLQGLAQKRRVVVVSRP